MRKLKVEVGKLFGRLTVLGEDPTDSMKFTLQCSCGKTLTATKGSVRCGNTTSCGCKRIDSLKTLLTTHGGAVRGGRHPLYGTWADMRKRCLNRNCVAYPDYGGRGIVICDRWGDFVNFVEDMGEKPYSTATLDRIDTNGNYEPSNCKWSSAYEQVVNQRKSLLYCYKGVNYELRQLAEISETFGVKYGTLKDRISKGIPVEQAVETPLAKVGWHPKPSDGRDRVARPGVVNLYESS